MKEGKIIQELLFARTLVANTKCSSIFNTVKDYFKGKKIRLANIMSVTTDGATAIVVVMESWNYRLFEKRGWALLFLPS